MSNGLRADLLRHMRQDLPPDAIGLLQDPKSKYQPMRLCSMHGYAVESSIFVSTCQYHLKAQPAFVLDRTWCVLQLMLISCIACAAAPCKCKLCSVSQPCELLKCCCRYHSLHCVVKQLDSADDLFVQCIDRLLVQQHEAQQFVSTFYSRVAQLYMHVVSHTLCNTLIEL